MASKGKAAREGGGGLAETEKYMANTFLGEAQYKAIYTALSSRWDRLHSLSAAMKLMEAYGVVLTPEEEQRLTGMEETQQINALVMKMPQQSNEQFQQFFLQLQLLVSTATRVRRALEDGRPDLVQEALNDADSTGISQYILRMAIVQAGSEVQNLREQYNSWMKEANAKCSKFIRGQEDAMTAQKRLAAAQAQMSMFTANQSEKSKKVIMNFAAQTDKGLVASSFGGWKSHTRQAKFEAEIRKEYADRIEEAEARLAEYKEKRLGNVRGMMVKKAMASQQGLLFEIFRFWKDDSEEAKFMLANADRVQELQEKLANMKASQSENAKKVLSRMSLDSENGILTMAWQAFVAFHQDYRKNKEMEEQIAGTEKKIAEYIKTRSDGAKKVLDKMAGATDSGLIQMCFKAWTEFIQDAKKEAEMEAIINSQQAKLGFLKNNTKDAGMNVMDRASYHVEQAILLKIFGTWRIDARMENTLRTYQQKIDSKRAKLVGVQQMFRKFAGELEGSLKASQQETRDLRDGPTPGRPRMHKAGGSVSLPDIHHKSGTHTPSTPSRRHR